MEPSTIPGRFNILALVVGLVLVFVLWQQDRDSQNVNVDFNTGGAGTVVESGPRLVSGSSEEIRLLVAWHPPASSPK